MLIRASMEKICFRWIIYGDGKINRAIKWVWKLFRHN